MAHVLELLKTTHEIESVVCVTAQHRKMLDSALALFNILPDYDFNIMKENQGFLSYYISSSFKARRSFKKRKT